MSKSFRWADNTAAGRCAPYRCFAAASPLAWLAAAVAWGVVAAVRADPILFARIAAPELDSAARQSPEAAGCAELDQARQCFRQRQYDQALQLLRQAALKHPDLPPVRLMLARLFLADNQAAAGRMALEQAAVEQPGYPGIYTTFGSLALGEGRLTDAALHFEKALALARTGRWTAGQRAYFLIQAHAGLAAVAEGRKDWPAARDMLTAWLELEPKNGAARDRLGRALFELEQPAAAAEQLEQAARDDPSLSPAGVTLAWLHTHKGNWERAAQWLETALRKAPNDPRVHLAKAQWLLQQDRAEEARDSVETVARLDPSARDVPWLRGLIARHLKDHAQAERWFQALHEQAPADFRASNQLAQVLIDQPDPGKRQRALQLAEMNARAYPQSSEVLATLGWVYYRLDRLGLAEQALQAAVAGGTASAETAYFLAHVLTAKGQSDRARELLQAAVAAPGHFLFRKDAQEWLARTENKPP